MNSSSSPRPGSGCAATRAVPSGVYSPGAPTEALIRCGRGAGVPDGLSSALAVEVVAATDALYASARTGAVVPVEQGTP